MRLPILAPVAITLLIASVPNGVAQEDDQGVPQITILVAGPDPEDSDSLFGHTALLVKYPDQTELAYTYIVYAPEGSWEALPSAAIGRALMDLREANAGAAINAYEEHSREIRRTPLLLTDDEAQTLAEQLAAIAEQEGPLPYDMINDNCSTRLRDLLDGVVGGALRGVLDTQTGETVRSITTPYLDHRLVAAPYWMFLAGDTMDVPITRWDSTFLPFEFEEAMKTPFPNGTNGTRTLAGETTVVTPSIHPDHDVHGNPWWSGVAAAGLAVALLTGLMALVIRSDEERGRRLVGVGLILIGIFVGLISIFIAIAWFDQLGPQAAHNQNLLIASPLAFMLAMVGGELRSSSIRGWRSLRSATVISLVLLVVALVIRWIPGVTPQDNMVFIAFAAFCWFCLLMLGASAISWKLLWRRGSRRTA